MLGGASRLEAGFTAGLEAVCWGVVLLMRSYVKGALGTGFLLVLASRLAIPEDGLFKLEVDILEEGLGSRFTREEGGLFEEGLYVCNLEDGLGSRFIWAEVGDFKVDLNAGFLEEKLGSRLLREVFA